MSAPAHHDAHGHADSWHHHDAAEGLPQHEHGSKVSPTALGITFVAMTLGVVFTILVLVAYYNSYKTAYVSGKQEGLLTARAEYETTRDQALARQREYGWVDRAAGTVHTPIEDAARRVVDAYARAQSAGAAGADPAVVTSTAITTPATITPTAAEGHGG
jgi:hypothetical protein